jgi:hypothetical protein
MLCNAFSFNMLPADLLSEGVTVHVRELPLAEARRLAEGMPSVVGHADTAAIFSGLLDREVPVNRATLQVKRATSLLVGQYSGPRLPEGARTLPEGATIKWLLVTVE